MSAIHYKGLLTKVVVDATPLLAGVETRLQGVAHLLTDIPSRQIGYVRSCKINV
ncbi:hypothetical protein CY34DRAFT_805354 [Suillus luteus UH-Slu-Lm8-n1]|uniref:Uncharacterized protein n=1 Tax=Suillus luteus UH-Slu-Lm8-n1 TaxID=930992 RepID=A0A0D0BFL6_9AGAM|nr:hypothetical protein CY34DRAFT_805354 [Suillus luteus UH-Slu-Lm8-n1]